ncbi:hypothetical protein PMIN03_012584 [Paraphaeosphaeria minitans]
MIRSQTKQETYICGPGRAPPVIANSGCVPCILRSLADRPLQNQHRQTEYMLDEINPASQTPDSTLPHGVAFAFPPFPPITEGRFKYFTRGVSIAIENIAEGHEKQPLLESIKDLQDEMPDVSDWPRETIMKGSEYVYEALKAVCKDVDVEGGLKDEVIEQFACHVEYEKTQMYTSI